MPLECIKRSDGGVSEHNDSDLTGNSIPPNQNRRARRAVGMKSPNLNYFVQLSILLNANFFDQVGTAANHAFT